MIGGFVCGGLTHKLLNETPQISTQKIQHGPSEVLETDVTEVSLCQNSKDIQDENASSHNKNNINPFSAYLLPTNLRTLNLLERTLL